MYFVLHFLSVTQSKYKVITYIRFSHLDAFHKTQGEMAAVWSDSFHSKVDSQSISEEICLKCIYYFFTRDPISLDVDI